MDFCFQPLGDDTQMEPRGKVRQKQGSGPSAPATGGLGVGVTGTPPFRVMASDAVVAPICVVLLLLLKIQLTSNLETLFDRYGETRIIAESNNAKSFTHTHTPLSFNKLSLYYVPFSGLKTTSHEALFHLFLKFSDKNKSLAGHVR